MADIQLVPNRLLAIKEVAEILHVHERTVRRSIKANELRVILVRGTIRIHPDEVLRFIAAGVSA